MLNNDQGGDPQSAETRMTEELTAYLDGELDPENRNRVEERLSTDIVYRNELHRLERAWRLLDVLPPATVEDNFSRSTLAMVTTAASMEVEKAKAAAPKKRRRLQAVGALGIVACGLAGVSLGHWMWPDPNLALLRDLPLLEHFDAYRHADSVEFLRSLDREGVFAEESDHAN
jgi:anti-sigma factor RsiW